jgi:hypothetical protein
MIAHTSDDVVETDALIDLYVATVRKAVDDYRRGPGYSLKQARDYATARAFLDRTGLLQYVQQQRVDEEFLVDDIV